MALRLPIRRPPAIVAIALLLAVASYADHQLRRRPSSVTSRPAPAADDRACFDRRSGTVTAIADGRTLDVALDNGDSVHIRLLGVDGPNDAELNAKAAAYLSARAAGKAVTLRLDELARPADADGRLAAYVYLKDGELLNDAIVRDGWAFAHRAEPCDFGGQFESSETLARAAKRGLWRTITVEQMPAWRQRWLADRGLK